MRTLSIQARLLTFCCAIAVGSLTSSAQAVSSAELYTSASYSYGRFEARVQFAGGDGVVGSFFLWKDGSEQDGVFWNELDLETVWSDCRLLTNALYGNPEMVHSTSAGSAGNWCGSFHTYAYEWTPDYIAWFVDGNEIRRATGADAAAFRDNVPDGMQIHFNVWPGDSTFGGNFSPAILPLHQYINWVQYSSYANGMFTLEWREDFGGDSLPEGWVTGDWDSPKGLSTHSPANVAFIDGYAVISMTADDATGFTGTLPMDPEGPGPLLDPMGDDEEMPPDDPTPSDPGTGGSPGDDGPADEPVTGAGGAAGSPADQGAGGVAPDGVPTAPGEPTVPTSTSPGGTGTTPPPTEPAGQPAPTQSPEPAATTPGSPSSPANGVGTMPSGTTTTPQAGETSAPPPSVAPNVMASEAGSDGGCAFQVPGRAAHPWAWAALALALSVSWAYRRVRGWR